MSYDIEPPSTGLLDPTTEIVAAHARRNALDPMDLSRLIADTHAALRDLGEFTVLEPVLGLKPAVPVRKAVTPNSVTCLEDGKQFKPLKRHLASHFNLTPDGSGPKWCVPADYPMTIPNYSATRSALPRESGLGRKPAALTAEPTCAERSRKKIGLKFT